MTTQRELLDEGFWDGLKPKNWGKVARGAVRAGADIARTIAPEITKPLDNLETKVRGYGNSFKQGYSGVPDPLVTRSDARGITQQVAATVVNRIKMGLAQQNITLIPRYGIEQAGIDPHNGNKLYKLKASSSTNPRGEWIIVDGRGNRQTNP